MIEDKGSDEGINLIEIGDSDNKDLIDLGDKSKDEVFLSPESKVILSPKPKPKTMDPDKGMSDEYKMFLAEKKFPLPSEIIHKNIDPTKSILPKINQQIKKGKNSSQKNQQKRVSLINI